MNPDGSESHGWVILKNVQFKHVNLCMNEVSDEVKENLAAVLRRTNDDFGVTLSGNPISKESIDQLQKLAMEVHSHKVYNSPHDPNVSPQVDPYIGLKRIAF